MATLMIRQRIGRLCSVVYQPAWKDVPTGLIRPAINKMHTPQSNHDDALMLEAAICAEIL